MTEGASIVTMSYLGAERVLDGYNVMGVAKAALEASMRYLAADLGREDIRVNAISAGAIRTLAAKGVPSFNQILHKIEETAPLKRNTNQEEVADMTIVMLSQLSRGVTGETIYVDSGYNLRRLGLSYYGLTLPPMNEWGSKVQKISSLLSHQPMLLVGYNIKTLSYFL